MKRLLVRVYTEVASWTTWERTTPRARSFVSASEVRATSRLIHQSAIPLTVSAASL